MEAGSAVVVLESRRYLRVLEGEPVRDDDVETVESCSSSWTVEEITSGKPAVKALLRLRTLGLFAGPLGASPIGAFDVEDCEGIYLTPFSHIVLIKVLTNFFV